MRIRVLTEVKILLLLALMSCIANTAFAKKSDSTKHYKDYNNSIEFSATNSPKADDFFYDIRHEYYLPYRMGQLAMYYERCVYKNLRIKVGFNEWNETGFLSYVRGPAFVVERGSPIDEVGSLLARWSYKMIESFGVYRFNLSRKHKIKTAFGMSYTWGLNEIVDSVYHNPGGGDGIIFARREKCSYWGIVPALSYDYLCIHNRISIGLDVRLRRYFGISYSFADYGYHLSVNF